MWPIGPAALPCCAKAGPATRCPKRTISRPNDHPVPSDHGRHGQHAERRHPALPGFDLLDATGPAAVLDAAGDRNPRAERVVSICTGAFAAGGGRAARRATCHHTLEPCRRTGAAIPCAGGRDGCPVTAPRRDLNLGQRKRRHGPHAGACRGGPSPAPRARHRSVAGDVPQAPRRERCLGAPPHSHWLSGFESVRTRTAPARRRN